MAEIDTAKLRVISEKADAVANGPWERDRERQYDAPYKHDEFFVIDGIGNRMFGTENCDASFGEVKIDYDEDRSAAWNEPARRVIEHTVAFQPATALALLDEIDRLRALLKLSWGALRPFAGLAVEDQEMPVADDMRVSIPLMSKEPWREIFLGNLRAARTVAREIEEAIGHE